LHILVEMAGIEPASENQSLQASPGAVGLFRFPHRNAARQAFRFGIPWYNPALRGRSGGPFTTYRRL